MSETNQPPREREQTKRLSETSWMSNEELTEQVETLSRRLDALADHERIKRLEERMDSSLNRAAKILCEERGHSGARPCQFCAMQLGSTLHPLKPAEPSPPQDDGGIEERARNPMRALDPGTWFADAECARRRKVIADFARQESRCAAIEELSDLKDELVMQGMMAAADVVRERITELRKSNA